jgi:hypothetical protein
MLIELYSWDIVLIKTNDNNQKGFDILQDLCRGQPAAHATRQRVPYTADKVETIELYFEGHIASGDVPHAHECQEFLRDHPMDRDHKQIRDKVTCR